MGLWSTKSIAALQADPTIEGGEPAFDRTLGASDLTSLGIGAIMGAGIFVLTGTASAQYAGPAVVLSFLFAALGCFCAALCYAEFASMIPGAGSAYTYSYAAFGELTAWLVGWGLILEYLLGAAAVAVSWSGYVVGFLREFGISLPMTLTQSAYTGDWLNIRASPGGMVNLPAIALVLLMTGVLVAGIRSTARVNNLIVVVKLAIVVLVIALGFAFVKRENWQPFIPPNGGTFGRYGWSGVFRAATLVFFAFIGFDAVSTATQESKNPPRDMPVGILASLGICTLLYVLMALVMTGLARYTDLNVPHPSSVVVAEVGSSLVWLGHLIKIAAMAGLASVVLVLLMGQSRIFFAMSRDGLLPSAFGRVSPRRRTPVVSTMIAGVLAAAIAGFAPIGLIGEVINIGALLGFTAVAVGILVVRYRRPNIRRPFRTPLVPIVPLLAVAYCIGVVTTIPADAWVRLAVWMAAGLVVYFLYGARRSRLSRDGSVPAP